MNENLINKNQVDDQPNQDDFERNAESDMDADDDLDTEDYDPDLKEKILQPASTRSKIVVNLKMIDGELRKGDKIEYELDPYDEVRMKLYWKDQRLFKAYQETVRRISEDRNLHPKKRQTPVWRSCLGLLVEVLVLILMLYAALLLVQLALFNLVIIGILFVMLKKLYNFLEACRWKCNFDYKTSEFNKFIAQQKEVYDKMNIELNKHPWGEWLEFQLSKDEKMFEQVISERRKDIFEQNLTHEIEEMKTILDEYKIKKEQQQRLDD